MATSQIKKFQRSGLNLSSWDLIATVTEGGSYKIRVVPGLLNNFLATNWDTESSVTGEALHYAKAIVSTNGIGISNVSITIDSTPAASSQPLIASIPDKVEIVFGLIKNGTTYRTVPVGQIFISPRLWIRVPKSEPVNAGESLYDEYYFLSS